MKKERVEINGIPSVIWGEKSKKVYIAVHGNLSYKEDVVICMLADKVVSCGYQLLSFDLPEHGDRKENKEYLCKVQNGVKDLKEIIEYAKSKYDEIYLWGCSLGAYFSLLAYKDENIKQCLFMSPAVNMKNIIDNMMIYSNVTEEDLKEKQEIKTDFGLTLYWDAYEYIKNNPITKWDNKTYILYGENDDIQDINTIKDFCNKFNAELTIQKNGEHFFHTDEELEFYKNWLNIIIKE